MNKEQLNKLASVFNNAPKVVRVTQKNEDGSHSLDWNAVIELLTKLAGIAGIIVSVWAVKQGVRTETKADQNRAVLDEQYSSNYVEQVISNKQSK